MIRCGLALELDGTWDINQLFSHLKEIIEKHFLYFHDLEVLKLPRGQKKNFFHILNSLVYNSIPSILLN